MDLFAELLAIVDVLDAGSVEYAICGGVALAIHGVPRATRDIDILARMPDVPRIKQLVHGCGFTMEALPIEFSATGITIQHFTKLATGGPPLMLDVLVADAVESVWKSRLSVAVAGPGDTRRSLWVVSREGLITLKLAAGRAQDLVDIERLKEAARGEDDA